MPVIDHWWQTETGWSICANPAGIELMPVKHGSPTKPVPGWDVRVVDEANNEVAPGEIGALVARLPLPPGSFPTLWQAEDRYRAAYLEEFPGYYKTGDAGFIDEDGYVYVMTRTDDVINVAGHRLSTARAGTDRAGCLVQDGDRRGAAAEDAVGQDPAGHGAEDRGQRGVHRATHDRRPRHSPGDRGSAPFRRLRGRVIT